MYYDRLRRRIQAARNRANAEPSLKITFADGRTITTDAGSAVDYLWQGEPLLRVENHSGNNGMLADLINNLIEQQPHNT